MELFIFLIVVVACGFGPGIFLLRRFDWEPAETFVGAIALSLVIVYLGAFLGFWLELGPAFNMALTGLSALALAVSWRDAVRLLRRPQVRPLVLGLLLLQVWLLGSLLLIRHYSGGDSCCDWVEHYQRTHHFIERLPEDFAYINRYAFTARPPMQNLLSAHVLAQIDASFAWHQVVFTLLASLLFLPCALVARLLARRGFRHPVLLAIVLAGNPMFFVNATYPWTKALTAFFVVLGIWFYLRGWRRVDRGYLPAAFLCFGAGILVHYSAVPYALFFAAHYLVVLFRQQPSPKQSLVSVTVPSLLVLIVWFGWAVATYGFQGAFLSNSTVDGLATSWRESLDTMVANIAGTLRPNLFAPEPDHTWLRALTDRTFMLYQVNLFFGIGSVGGVVAFGLMLRASVGRWWRTNPATRLFWWAFIVFMVVVGVAVHSERQETGLAFIGLQPLIYMAVALVVANVSSLPLWARAALVCGIVADFVLGVVLQIHMQHEMAAWSRSPNWEWKREHSLVYLGDYVYQWAGAVKACLAGAAVAAIVHLLAVVRPFDRDAGGEPLA